MTNRLRFSAPLIAASLLLSVAAPVRAETAQGILQAARERQEKRLASIETLTIVQDFMGTETTTRLKKEMVDGHPVLVASGSGLAGDVTTLYGQFEELGQSATVKGTEDVDGNKCWVIHSTDLAKTHMSAEGTEDFQASDGTFYIDRNEMVMRRLVMNGTAKQDGAETPVRMEMNFSDFREVEGWIQPYRIEMSLGGQGGEEAPQMAEMRAQMAKMKEELAKMPPEQRQMVEKMMKGQMATLEQTAESGKLSVTVTVKEVRVNEAAE